MTKRQPPALTPSPESASAEDATQTRILDAADALLQARGVHGVTIAELARRSGMSRPTIYRNWSDADDVVRATLLRRVVRILTDFPEPAPTRSALVEDVLRFSALFRTDAVYARLLAEEPEVFTRYTLQRVGSSQRVILTWLATAIARAQSDGSVRSGDSGEIAVMTLIIAQSALLSHGTVSELIDEPAWDRELRAALEGHLRP